MPDYEANAIEIQYDLDVIARVLEERATMRETLKHLSHHMADVYASGQKPALDTVMRWRDQARDSLSK